MPAIPEQQFNLVDHSDPMRGRILDAAEHCIHRYGIRRTTMGEVARAGKLSRGSIYRHFADKSALIEGVFRRLQEAYLNRAESALELESTLVDKMTLSVMLGRQNMGEGIFASLARIEPETVAMMFLDPRFYSRSLKFWPPHIRQAQATGEVCADLEVGIVTDVIMRLVVSLVMFPDMGAKLSQREDVRAYLARVVASGLSATI